MLNVTNLYCERQKRILFDGLSFSLGAGELLQVRGNNGCGKTTLLKILTGLFEDYEGQVDWQMDSWPVFVSHKPGVKDELTARENLAWLMKLQQPDCSEEQISQALSTIGLSGFEDSLCGSMSEGQRKRVNLARLMFVDSPVWILDEPLSAIDVDGIDLLQEKIKQHIEAQGLVIMTSHQPVDIGIPVQVLDLSRVSC